MWKAAKPFPSPIKIGTDICHIPRIKTIIQRDHPGYTLRWAAKVFNRLEWNHFRWRLDIYSREPNEVRLQRLATWLAGRWALKEAAIKAHTSRQLFMRQITVFPDSSVAPETQERTQGRTEKPFVLIDPPPRTVLMDHSIATKRGLRMGMAIQWVHKDDNETSNPSLEGYNGPGRTLNGQRTMFQRYCLIPMEERRLADASISHDGDYAIAVCQALDEPSAPKLEDIVDDGHGGPLHEPEFGDIGFERPRVNRRWAFSKLD